MKLEGMRTVNNDKQVTVYQIGLNKEEIKLLYDIVTNSYISIPKGVLELGPTKGRLRNMRKVFNEILYG